MERGLWRSGIIAALVTVTGLVGCGATGSAAPASAPAAPDPANATYLIERNTVTLANGRAEHPAAPGSATTVVTTLGTERAAADLDGDGRPDTVVVLTYQPGGTGEFSYIAALLNGAAGVTPTPAILLGDRVTVTGLRTEGRAVVVETLERAAGDPLTATPTVPMTRTFVVDRGALVAK